MQLDPQQPKLKPLNQGLGLDHFSEGLPYTPDHMRRRGQKPVHASSPEKSSVKQMIHFNFPELNTREAVEGTEQFSAGFVKRVFAYLVDLSVTITIFAAIVWGSFKFNGFDLAASLESRNGFQIILPLILLYFVVYLGYFLTLETTWRSTVGKAMMGISIKSSSGFSTIGRSLCFFLSAIPFGAGLFWYFFDAKKRCWHDMITESEVVKSH